MADHDIDNLKSVFTSGAEKSFGFLAQYGFARAEAEASTSSLTLQMKYIARHVGVVLFFDVRSQFTGCYVVTVSHGRIDWEAPQYQLFSYLLRKCGYRDRMLPDVSKATPLAARIRAALECYAEALKSHGRAILMDDPDALS